MVVFGTSFASGMTSSGVVMSAWHPPSPAAASAAILPRYMDFNFS